MKTKTNASPIWVNLLLAWVFVPMVFQISVSILGLQLDKTTETISRNVITLASMCLVVYKGKGNN